MFAARAAAKISIFQSPLVYRMHENMSLISHCRCVKNVMLKGRFYFLLNCILRIQCGIELTMAEKEQLLHAISRRLFFVSPALEMECRRWLSQRPDFSSYVFTTTGVHIKESVSLKLAMKSMSYETSFSMLPRNIPFLTMPLMFVSACRLLITGTLFVRGVTGGSILTQPVCLRSMLESMCHPAYWPIVSEGLCYLPGFRQESFPESEMWVFHVHGAYGEPHPDCKGKCMDCSLRQPVTLFHLAQLAVIRNLFLKRRARLTGNKKSIFYK
ncbi:ORF20 [Duck adenovirus 4]|uniref:ORF20 n=1 Tax=Duck adenovirus 4 TaxID=2726020 RepID=A0A6M3Q9G6_9ADEN|nr:ORF20 [Duck adenovirus 4]